MSTALPLISPRLTLGMMTTKHLETFLAYRREPKVAEFQSWSADYSRTDATALIDSQATQTFAVPDRWYQLAIDVTETGQHVGDLAFHLFDEGRQGELGFTIAGVHQGKGYATEAVTLLLDHVFSQMGVSRVIALTDGENGSAGRRLDRLGFRREGHHLKSYYTEEGWRDELAFAVLAHEWQGRG